MKNYNILPKKHVEYVLRIPETGNILRCVYEDMLENGRLRFVNLQYNNYTEMTIKRFSYLYSKHKKAEKPYTKDFQIEMDLNNMIAPNTSSAKIKTDDTIDAVSSKSSGMSLAAFLDEFICDLNKLSTDEKARFYENAGKPIDDYINLLKASKNSYTSIFSNNACDGILFEIDEILNKCNIHIA